MKHLETGEWIEIPEDAVENVTLEHCDDAQVLPMTNGDFVQISNYLMLFWSPIIGSGPLSVYLHLLMHTSGKQTAWPSRRRLAAECGVSTNSLNRYFEVLESYYLAWKICVEKPDGSNESNIYVVRRNIPMLTQEQYDELPEMLKDEHDQLIYNLGRSEHLGGPRYHPSMPEKSY